MDLCIISLCFALAGLLTFTDISDVSFIEFMSMRVKIGNFLLFGVLMAASSRVLSSFKLYHSRRLSKWYREFVDIVSAVSVCTLITLLVSYIFDLEIITKSFLAVFWLSATLFMSLSRFMLKQLLRRMRLFGRNLRYALIIGTNDRALQVARMVNSDRRLGYRLLGFVDDQWEGNTSFEESQNKIVSDVQGFRSYLRENAVDEVFICNPIKSHYDQTASIISFCEELGVTVHLDKEIFTPKIGIIHRDLLTESSWITVDHHLALSDAKYLKTLLDKGLSGIALVLLSPVLLVAAILIKLDSPGRVFFVQERVGLNRRRFNMYKFRTMVNDAEKLQDGLEADNEASGPVFKISNDPRVTRVGRLLRSTSIDELPQLFNVLKGDMAVVGPRPLPIRDFEGFEEDRHRRRFSMKPGITCLWQVEGRSNVTFDEWMQMDMRYIDQWSLWLDFKIILKTIPAVVRGTGAY